jgi:hypothetical protein
MLCLVAEYAAEDSEFAQFTRAHPGSTVDLMTEQAARDARAHTALALVRGAPWAAIEALVLALRRRTPPAQALRSDARQARWFGRVAFDVGGAGLEANPALARVIDQVGPPWLHVEAGVVHLRARLREPRHPDEVLALAEEGLREAGVEAQTIVQEVAERDHSVWEDLVRHSIGLSL